MVLESYAIIALILIMAYIFTRMRRSSGYAVAILPLIIIPAVHIAGRRLVRYFSGVLQMQDKTAWVVLELTALVITCLLLGVISTNMRNRNLKITYLALCGGFSVILTTILLLKTIV
jgi:hypothetical protein